MRARISDRYSELTAKRFSSFLIVLIATFSVTVSGQSPSPADSKTIASESLLPRNVVVPLSVVNPFFPEVTWEASTGQNLTAVGNAKATRSVIYANSDNSKKVTITVDQYLTASDASSAFEKAVAKSKTVPGFSPVPAKDLGKNAFAGTVTQGDETHIGLGALHGPLIVGATLAGYDPTPENIAKVISLIREEEGVAKAAIDRKREK